MLCLGEFAPKDRSKGSIDHDADPEHRLEERRKAKSAAYYERKKVAQRQLVDARKNAKVDNKTSQALESLGY